MQKTLTAWQQANITKVASEAENGRQFAEFLKTIPYFGNWVSYKITEVFAETLDYQNLKPNDLNITTSELDGTGGPVGGLKVLYGIENTYSKEIIPEWEALGKTIASTYSCSIGEAESLLCKFYKLYDGRYYPGHDVAEFSSLELTLGQEKYKKIVNSCGFHSELLKVHDHKVANRAYLKERKIVNIDLIV